MAVIQYVLTLNGSAQSLGSVTNATEHAIRTVTLQAGTANANPFYIGDSSVSTTDYGVRVPAPVTNEPSAPVILGETQSTYGHFKLSDIYVRGTNNEKIHLLVLTVRT